MAIRGMSSRSRTILQCLQEMRQRLVDRDESLSTVHLWPATTPAMSSTYIALCLEDARIRRTLQDCLEACATSPVVTRLYLGNLPEPDLEAALLALAQAGSGTNNGGGAAATALQELYIGPLPASSSLSGKVVTKLLARLRAPRLTVLDVSCRLRLAHDAAVTALAAALHRHMRRQQSSSLRRLRLHVVPRTSIERPSLRLDALLESCRALTALHLTAGYPRHNPYRRPVVSCETVRNLVPANPRLEHLTLANLGLTGAHVQALLWSSSSSSSGWPRCLQELHLPDNLRLCSSTTTTTTTTSASSSSSSSSSPSSSCRTKKNWAARLAEQLQDPKHTTLTCVTAGTTCRSRHHHRHHQDEDDALQAVDVWTTLNRLGRRRLTQAAQGSAAHGRAWQDLMADSSRVECRDDKDDDGGNDTRRLNLFYTLIRQHPTLAIQSMSLSGL